MHVELRNQLVKHKTIVTAVLILIKIYTVTTVFRSTFDT